MSVLADLIAVFGAIGIVVGGVVGLWLPYDDNRRSAENVALASACGLVAASPIALAIGIVIAVAGG